MNDKNLAKAKKYLDIHGILSIVFLQRKLQISHNDAKMIMKKFEPLVK